VRLGTETEDGCLLMSYLSRNGVKIEAKPPRLFCDICDLFDLHDTEDCPTQASEGFDNSPPFSSQRSMPTFNQDSPSYKQHSHHGGTRGAMRPFCDICEGTYIKFLKFTNIEILMFSIQCLAMQLRSAQKMQPSKRDGLFGDLQFSSCLGAKFYKYGVFSRTFTGAFV